MYHLGQAFLCAQTASIAVQTGLDVECRLDLTVVVEGFLYDYIDRASETIAAVYRDEHDRWIPSPEARRAEALQAIMARRSANEQHLEQRLGYELSGFHTAFVLSTDDREYGYDDLLEEARRLSTMIDATGLLVVKGEGTTAWAWCRTTSDEPAMPDDAKMRWAPTRNIDITFAGPTPGLEGFRSAHFDALETFEFISRFPRTRASRNVTSYRSVELVLLLAQNHERAARFMRSRLGPLAGPDARLRALRETALGFLRHNRSHARAGEALYLHKNTIFMRVKRAESLLGLPSDAWGVELETALMLSVLLDDDLHD